MISLTVLLLNNVLSQHNSESEEDSSVEEVAEVQNDNDIASTASIKVTNFLEVPGLAGCARTLSLSHSPTHLEPHSMCLM